MFLSFFQETTLGPVDPKKVTTLSFIALGPWNLFLSWEAPSGVKLEDIIRYEITGSFVQEYVSQTRYNFISLAYGVIPSSSYVVVIKVVYRTGEKSDPTSITTSTPRSRKCFFIDTLSIIKP